MRQFGFIFSILILALVISTGSAKAQNVSKVGVNIPFEFSFGDKAYSPGRYTVQVKSNSNSSAVVSLSDEAGNDLQSVLATVANRSAANKSILSFDRSNGQLALTGIALSDSGYDLPRSNSKAPASTKNQRESRKVKGKSKSI
jgi:hypothetical protein